MFYVTLNIIVLHFCMIFECIDVKLIIIRIKVKIINISFIKNIDEGRATCFTSGHVSE